MSYQVEILDRKTGESKTITEVLPWYDEGSDFWWREGCMACDCNRGCFFFEDDEMDFPCNASDENRRFYVPRIILEDGTVVAIDEPLEKENQ